MKTVCAKSVLHARAAFETVGDVVVIPDSEIGPESLTDARALVTRSKTRIDRNLVADSCLEFVGTATAGFDHIDPEALEQSGIYWTAAPGCNAISVAEYVVAAMLEIALTRQTTLAGKTIAIVGVGQVGRRVASRAAGLGMQVLLNDPPRADRERNPDLMPLNAILPQADIVTLHTPLTDAGPHPTADMVDDTFFGMLKPGALFINAARGEVVDESALMRALDDGTVDHCVLDVWANEPYCRRDLLERVDIATPHIAGYSFDGKLRGTAMIHESLCEHFGLNIDWNSTALLPPSPVPEFTIEPSDDDEQTILDLIRSIYAIRADDADLRPTPLPDPDRHAELFSRLRKNYPIRREFAGTRVSFNRPDARLAKKLAALGFEIDQP